MRSTVPELIRVGVEAWSVPELAARAEVDASSLVRGQTGDLTGWNVGMLTRLSRAVGADPAMAMRGAPLPVPKLLAFLRQASYGIVPRDTVALRRALARASALREAGLHPVFAYLPSRAPGTRAYAAGYAAARRVRRDIGNEAGPIVDLRSVIEAKLGVIVAGVELESLGLEALAVADDLGAAVVLNLRMPRVGVIWRRSVAHELCHLLFDPRDNHGVVDVLVEDEPPLQGLDAQRANREQRARAFAAEFLVPSKGLKGLFIAPLLGVDAARRGAVQVCEHFGAPWELAVHHMVNHGVVDPSDGDRLLLERPAIETTLGVGSSAALGWARARVEEGELSEGRARDLFGADWPAGDPLGT